MRKVLSDPDESPLDKEKTFKGLTEHHEEREEDAMLKELDKKIDSKHVKQLVSDIKYTWLEVVASMEAVND